MLNQAHPEELNEQAAAKVRVTPEELAAAISRIEARKDADQRQGDGTIPIGDAVQQLGLEATPEEVLAEVQVSRRLAGPKGKRSSIAQRLVLALGLGGVLLGLALDVNGLQQMDSQQWIPPASVRINPQFISISPNLLVSDASGKLVTFSSVKDDQPVQCSLLESNNHLRFYQWTPSSSPQNLWTLIKHNGHIYVRGWIASTSPDVLETSGVDVFPHQILSDKIVPITLPLRGFQATHGPDNGAWFHATDIHLDQHANDPVAQDTDAGQP